MLGVVPPAMGEKEACWVLYLQLCAKGGGMLGVVLPAMCGSGVNVDNGPQVGGREVDLYIPSGYHGRLRSLS